MHLSGNLASLILLLVVAVPAAVFVAYLLFDAARGFLLRRRHRRGK